jgi:type VI secretion system protein ImpB
MAESTQHKLDRIRPPRVQITYDVETRGSFVKMELPFVVGIMADLSSKGGQMKDGNPIPLRDKKYMEIDRDNFNDIMSSIKPSVALNGGSTTYTFENLEDFSPIRLLKPANPEVNKVDASDASPLGLARADYDRRTKLSDMVAKLDGNVPLQKKFLAELQRNNGQELKETAQAIKDEATPPATSAELKQRDDAQKAFEDAQKKVLEAQQKVEAKKLVDDAKTQVTQATEKLNAAQAPGSTTAASGPQSEQEIALNAANEDLKTKKAALDEAQKKLETQKQVDDAQKQVDEAHKRLAKAQEQLTPGVVSDTPTAEERAVDEAQKTLDEKKGALTAKKNEQLEQAEAQVVKETQELKAAEEKLKKEKGEPK